MERSISSLTYKGSVREAILEAKRQKKLFVVYISGEDALSANLESSTLTDAKVAESLSKYCIFLHIPDGGPDAVNFSAIYPQKPGPCITAVGYNGVQVWQSDVSSSSRNLSAEDLASSLEKAWLSLHIQETTATFLTAALASKQSESSSRTSDLPSTEQGSSSSIIGQSASNDKNAQSSNDEQSVASEIVEEKNSIEHAAKKKVEELGDKISSESSTSKSLNVDNKRPTTEKAKEPVKSPRADPENSGTAHLSSNTDNGNLIEEKKVDHHSDVSKRSSPLIIDCTNKSEGKKAVTEDRSVDTSDECQKVNRSSDVHLNIRLPDGVSLRETFSVTDTLRMVKEYVDKNQQNSVGSYDLAVPYPRKLFTDQELGRSLLELDLLDRQALIVVPRQASYRGGSSSFNKSNSTPNSDSSDGNIGYFSVIGKVLSFFNPFSYLSNGASSSSSGQESQNGTWQYRPNPALRTTLAGTPYSTRSPNQQTSETGKNDSRSKKPTTANRFGSNIHTLKHDEEDDKRFGDGNKFWNGNSTQYGGGSNDKK